jgi:hypothetical protein
VLEPLETFEPSWHHEAIAVVLLGSNGKKTRKFINAPPRSLKSFLASVSWVAWVLGHEPRHKFVCASYSHVLASNLAAQCRRLMLADMYRRLFATRLSKMTDSELVTTNGGCRISTSVEGTLTGSGADTLIVDDPLSASEAYSEISRKRTKIAELAISNKVPTIHGLKEMVDAGGLIAFGASFHDLYRRAASQVKKILQVLSLAIFRLSNRRSSSSL